MPVANAVIAGPDFLILDAGEGTSRTMGVMDGLGRAERGPARHHPAR